MKKQELNEVFRSFVRDNLSPKKTERDFISKLYGEIQSALGQNNCRQIGSYPRSTAITPVEDLDILYIAGEYSDFKDEPLELLRQLANILESHLKKAGYNFKIEPIQTHSVCISFPDKNFSVDVVPAYKWAQNEFGDAVFKVPEIINVHRTKRVNIYNQRQQQGKHVGWVLSDPLGYIKVAQQVDNNNSDFRKTAKLVKRWKFGVKKIEPNFKLKSFHIEQVITGYFRNDPSIEIFDAIFKFFVDLPKNIQKAQIPDRADSTVFIDEYVNKLNETEKQTILAARDTFLMNLENISKIEDIPALLNPKAFHYRGQDEKFMFDDSVPTMLQPEYAFNIDGQVTDEIVDNNGKVHKKHASPYWLSSRSGKSDKFRRIIFSKVGKFNAQLKYYWKVKNDHKLETEKVRGEITFDKTKNHPEQTLYPGNHHVECYAVLNGVCVAKSKSNVHIS